MVIACRSQGVTQCGQSTLIPGLDLGRCPRRRLIPHARSHARTRVHHRTPPPPRRPACSEDSPSLHTTISLFSCVARVSEDDRSTIMRRLLEVDLSRRFENQYHRFIENKNNNTVRKMCNRETSCKITRLLTIECVILFKNNYTILRRPR